MRKTSPPEIVRITPVSIIESDIPTDAAEPAVTATPPPVAPAPQTSPAAPAAPLFPPLPTPQVTAIGPEPAAGQWGFPARPSAKPLTVRLQGSGKLRMELLLEKPPAETDVGGPSFGSVSRRAELLDTPLHSKVLLATRGHGAADRAASLRQQLLEVRGDLAAAQAAKIVADAKREQIRVSARPGFAKALRAADAEVAHAVQQAADHVADIEILSKELTASESVLQAAIDQAAVTVVAELRTTLRDQRHQLLAGILQAIGEDLDRLAEVELCLGNFLGLAQLPDGVKRQLLHELIRHADAEAQTGEGAATAVEASPEADARLDAEAASLNAAAAANE